MAKLETVVIGPSEVPIYVMEGRIPAPEAILEARGKAERLLAQLTKDLANPELWSTQCVRGSVSALTYEELEARNGRNSRK